MAKPKNKKSTEIHVSRQSTKKSRVAKKNDFSQKSFSVIKKVILCVVVLAMMVVVLAALTTFFAKPEDVVKKRIDDIVTDYYENYYYDLVLSYAPTSKPLEEIMKPYKNLGFQTITLRQLTLFDGRRHAETEKILFEYCDPDDTTIHIYPEAPYSKTDYRVEYNYACIF